MGDGVSGAIVSVQKRPRPNSRKKRRERWRVIRGHVAAGRLLRVNHWVYDRVVEERSWYFGRHR